MQNVSLFPSHKYDVGSYPSVGINANKVVVEVHKNQLGSSLYYHVGSVTDDAIDWGPSTYYDDGNPAKCAVNDAGVAVEIHQSNGLYSNLWYHVGQVSGQAINWSKNNSQKSGSGSNPDIALNNNNIAVEVHEDGGNVVFRSGSVDVSQQKISFGSETTIAGGSHPSIALTDDNRVMITYDSGDSISWWLGILNGSSLTRQNGGSLVANSRSSVAMNEDGFVVVGYGSGDLFSVSGTLDGNNVNWLTPVPLGQGSEIGVGLAGGQAIQVHLAPGLDYDLLSSTSQIADRSNWMGDSMDEIGDLGLSKLVFPAAHDAGMYVSRACTIGGFHCNTQTQDMGFGGMLNMGIRYFDVRPSWYENQFDTGHYANVPVLGIQGCNGGSLSEILDEVLRFANSSRNEVAILKFSHYYNKTADEFGFTESMMQNLIDTVTAALPGKLYINTTGERLADIPLRELTSSGTCIIAVFEGVGPLADPSQGIYSYADYTPGAPLNADLVVYDQYADSNDLFTMSNDQISKLENTANHGGDLFLLSWTLTQSATQASTCGVPGVASILDLATEADAVLASSLQPLWDQGRITQTIIPNVLYVDLANGFATDVAVWLNQKLNP